MLYNRNKNPKLLQIQISTVNKIIQVMHRVSIQISILIFNIDKDIKREVKAVVIHGWIDTLDTIFKGEGFLIINRISWLQSFVKGEY